jgi:hypothetical protein
MAEVFSRDLLATVRGVEILFSASLKWLKVSQWLSC